MGSLVGLYCKVIDLHSTRERVLQLPFTAGFWVGFLLGVGGFSLLRKSLTWFAFGAGNKGQTDGDCFRFP